MIIRDRYEYHFSSSNGCLVEGKDTRGADLRRLVGGMRGGWEQTPKVARILPRPLLNQPAL